MLRSLVWLIPLLPLLAAGWIGLCAVVGWYRGERGERPIARLAFAAVLFPLLLLLLLDVSALLRGVPGQLVFGSWFASGEYRVQLSFTLDALGLSLATLVALICLATLGFSVDYMHREAGFQRFFMLLSLFSGAMLLALPPRLAAETSFCQNWSFSPGDSGAAADAGSIRQWPVISTGCAMPIRCSTVGATSASAAR